MVSPTFRTGKLTSFRAKERLPVKILYASSRPPFPFFLGGAARSAHNMMAVMSRELGCSCLALGSREFRPDAWSIPSEESHQSLHIRAIQESDNTLEIDCGYPVRLVSTFPESLRRTIDEWKPDVIWTQLEGMEQVAAIGLGSGKPTIVFLRDAEDPPSTLKEIARSGAAMICNSYFMANRLQRMSGRTAHVIYPSIAPLDGCAAGESGFITMINPHRVKGFATFLEIAGRLPEERFLVVESWPLSQDDKRSLLETISKLGNVEYSDRVPNIETIYRKTKLLLVPSIWEEAFGRVVIEAESCGIPVIASARGGLPEAVGQGGVCIEDYLNADVWVKEIRSLLDQPARYRELSELAVAHAQSEIFSTRYAAQSFLDFALELTQTKADRETKKSSLRRFASRFLPYFGAR